MSVEGSRVGSLCAFGYLVAAGGLWAATPVTEPAVHRTADPPAPVLVDDNGGTWPGHVLGWRGDRVYVTYSSGVGLKHLTWVAANQVHRV